MMDMDDEGLVRSALAGDQRAFGELANRYRDAAFGIAFHRLGDFEAARDAAQEALVTAYLDLPTLRDPSKFGNWLYRIAGMKAAAIRRRQQITVSLDAPGIAERLSSEPAPIESEENTRLVRDALSTLSENERLAVILHYVNGYSHAEIGDMLGASIPAVKSRIHRARGRLREEMRGMVEETLRTSTLERFDLKPLPFWAFQGDYLYSELADRLAVKVTGAFGGSSTIMVGADFAVCGEYSLKGESEIELRLVTSGVSTGHTAPLRPGEGRFELYCHIDRLNHGPRGLAILMPDDRSSIHIKLGHELNLRPLRYSLQPGHGDEKPCRAMRIEVGEVLGSSAVVEPGAVFVVRGEYTLAEPIITALCVDADGTTSGFQDRLAVGRHSFETMGEIRKVNPGKERLLYLHMFGDGEELGIHTYILLEE